MSEKEARQILDDYIKNNDEKLTVVKSLGAQNNSCYHFLCKSLDKSHDYLPGETDSPTLAVFEDGSVLPLPT